MRENRVMTVAKRILRERVRRTLLLTGGFLASVLPLAVLFVLRWDRYTALPGGALRLTLGGGMILILLLLKVLGMIRLPSRLTVMVITLVMVYLLKGLLDDLTVILWAAILGEAVDTVIFSPLARAAEARLVRLRQADVTACAVREMMKE